LKTVKWTRQEFPDGGSFLILAFIKCFLRRTY